MIVQLCGMSGAGKTTLARNVKNRLQQHGIKTEVIDGDEYREVLCKDLGFSKEDRCENIRRLGFVASRLSANGIVAIISAINPFEEMRREMKEKYRNVKTVYVDCEVAELISRDTKGLYRKALLPEGHPDRITNLTGINDRFDVPATPDLYINTAVQQTEESITGLFQFITGQLSDSIYFFQKQHAQRLS